MKFTCVCDHTFTLTDIPSRDCFQLFSDDGIAILMQAIVQIVADTDDPMDVEDKLSALFYGRGQRSADAIECPVCKRLNITADNKLRLAYSREALPRASSSGEAADLYAVLTQIEEN
jgi:hypothetical protein